MQERTKLKAIRGEGTITQWEAVSKWTGKRMRYVADETGNWNDTEYWSVMKDNLYTYQQAHGEQPLLKTWNNNAYYNAEGQVVRDENGNTIHGHYNRPSSMRTEGLRQKPTLWYLEQLENQIKALRPIMRLVRHSGAVIVGSTVESPHSDRHIRKFVVTKGDVKDVTEFITTTSSRVIYHPSGENKKVPTPNVRLFNANLMLPKGIKRNVKLTPAHAEEFFAWAEGATKAINKMKVEATTQKTLNDIDYFKRNVTGFMTQYIEISKKIAESKIELPSRIEKHQDNLAKGRVVADAIIAYRGLDMSIEEVEKFYKIPRSERSLEIDSGLVASTYNEINKWTFNLKWNCPQKSYDKLLQELNRMKNSIISTSNNIKRLAPIGGEALINEQISSKENLGGAKSVEEFFAIHEDAVGDEE